MDACSPAVAATWPISSCPASCTPRSCAVRMPTRASGASTRAARARSPVAGPAEGAVGDVARGFAQAHEVVEARLSVPRIAAMPIEPRGVVAQPDAPDGRLTVWSSTQVPFAVRAAVAAALGLAEEQVRV